MPEQEGSMQDGSRQRTVQCVCRRKGIEETNHDTRNHSFPGNHKQRTHHILAMDRIKCGQRKLHTGVSGREERDNQRQERDNQGNFRHGRDANRDKEAGMGRRIVHHVRIPAEGTGGNGACPEILMCRTISKKQKDSKEKRMQEARNQGKHEAVIGKVLGQAGHHKTRPMGRWRKRECWKSEC